MKGKKYFYLIKDLISSNKMIFFGLAMGIYYWVIESGIQAFVFQDGNYMQWVLPYNRYVFLNRVIIFFIFIFFSFYTQSLLSRREKDQKQLGKKTKQIEEAYNKLQEQSQQLIQSEKMSAVGTMTAGLTHELKNPMMGILNFIQYSLKYTSKDDKRYIVLQDAERETKSCLTIVHNFLAFSHKDKEAEEAYQKESCSAVFDRVFQLISYRIEKQKVLLIKHYTENMPDIFMRVNQIQQVFLNLIVNALDALQESKKKEICIDIHPEEEFVYVSVSDTGCGIEPDSLAKMFKPFFTTKPVGEGLGLGLYICRNIIEGHGGEMRCESELGRGTKFVLLLPVSRKIEKEKEKEYVNF